MYYQALKEELTLLFKKIDTLKKRSPESCGVALLESKARDQAFHIEGLLRFLIRNKSVSSKKIKHLEKLLKHAKSLEDALGKVDEALALEKTLQTQQTRVNTNPLVRSQSALVKTLALKSFGSDRYVNRQLVKLQYLKGWSRKKNVKTTRKAFKQELERLIEKTSADLLPNIQKKPFSYELMEFNFHEFRRMLRWIPIYVHSLQGMFGLTPFELAGFNDKEKRILRKYKGNVFTEVRSDDPSLFLDRYGFYMFSHTIARSGQIKDSVEMYYKLKGLKLKAALNTEKYRQEMISVMLEFLESGAAWRVFDGLK